MENQSVKKGFWHKLFGTTPNDGNMQPREAIAYSITGIGQNFICTIIGSYLTIFMTDALLMADAKIGKTTGATAVALLMSSRGYMTLSMTRLWALLLTEQEPNGANAARILNGWLFR